MIDRFHITAEEKEAIYGYVNAACAENGFASLSDVPLGDIIEENYELSITTIWNAVYKAVLMKHFWLNGKILTRDKPELDAVSLLKRIPQLVLQADWQEVWHSPQPPFFALSQRLRVSMV